jgi:hypothetical protein
MHVGRTGVVRIGSIWFVTKYAVGNNPTAVLPTSHYQIKLIKNAFSIKERIQNLKETILPLLYSVPQ